MQKKCRTEKSLLSFLKFATPYEPEFFILESDVFVL